MPEQQITEEQAANALRQLVADQKTATEPEAKAAEPQTAEEAPVEEPAAEADEPVAAATEADAAEAPEAATQDDDVASLRQRLDKAEKDRAEADARFNERLTAINQRASDNQRILNDRFLRKATVADRALKTLRSVRSETGLPEAEVDRVIQEIEATMNPASQSYAPPPQQQRNTEDRDIALNEFLNERQMTATEAVDFGRWVQTEAPNTMTQGELNVANESVGGFLRLAHDRWQGSIRAKSNQRTEAVEAVKTVQRTQKQAARAASAAPAAPRKTTVKSAQKDTIDFKDVTPEMVSDWARKSVEQYK